MANSMAKDYWPLALKEIELSKNYVHVWSIRLDQTSETTSKLRQILSLEERSRADKFYFEHDRNRFTVARAILRTILGNCLGQNPSEIEFSYAKNGKPFLVNTDLRFNLSHSKDLALCAITYQRELGVDIEYLRLMKDAEQIAARFFSPRESSLFCSLSQGEKQLAFFRCWTRKEAYIKAIGDGLSYGLDKFDVTFTQNEPVKLLRVLSNPKEVERWSLKELEPAEDFIGAVIVEGNDWELCSWQYLI